jgi:hypothetical protein
MKYLVSFLLLFCGLSAFSQADTIFVLGAEFGATTEPTDSTFTVDIIHPTDQLGQAFTASKIQVGYRLIDVFGRLYRVKSVDATGIGSSTLTVVELQDGNAPSGTGLVYRKPDNSDCIPEIQTGDIGISYALAARIANHNAVVGCGGTDDQTASEVPIVDAGGYYVATEVEAALQEEAVNRIAVDLLVGDLISLTGVPFSSTTLGTFINPLLPDNEDIKTVFETLADSTISRIDEVARSSNIRNTIFAAEGATAEPLRNSILRPFPTLYDIVDSLQAGDDVRLFQGTYSMAQPYANPLLFLNKEDDVTYSFLGQGLINAPLTNALAPLFSDGGNFATASPRTFLLDAPFTDIVMSRGSGSFAGAIAFHHRDSEGIFNVDDMTLTGGRVWALHVGAKKVIANINTISTTGGIAVSVWRQLQEAGEYVGAATRNISIKIGEVTAENTSDNFGTLRMQTINTTPTVKDSLSTIDVYCGVLNNTIRAGTPLLLGLSTIVDSKISYGIGVYNELFPANTRQIFGLATEDGLNQDTIRRCEISVRFGTINGSGAAFMTGGVTGSAGTDTYADSSLIDVSIGRAWFSGSGGNSNLTVKHFYNGSTYTQTCNDCRHSSGTFFTMNSTTTTENGGKIVINGSYKTNDASALISLSNTAANITVGAKLFNSTGTGLITASTPITINVTRESNVRQFNVGPNVTVNVLGAEVWNSEVFTATAAQVDFTVSAGKLPPTPANIRVYDDAGAKLRLTDHYTYVPTTGVVTLVTPATAGEKYTIEYFQ